MPFPKDEIVKLSNLFFNQLFCGAGVQQDLALVKDFNASGDSAVAVHAQAALNDLSIGLKQTAFITA